MSEYCIIMSYYTIEYVTVKSYDMIVLCQDIGLKY